MPKYRYTGVYDFPPDRGGPYGDQLPVTQHFEAESDEAVLSLLKQWKRNRRPILNEHLLRIVQEEVTEEVPLSS